MKNKSGIESVGHLWVNGFTVSLLFAIFTLLLSACGSPFSFEEKKEIPNAQWTYADTLDFRFSIADTTETYNLYLDFEYADSYSTQNLYLRLHTKFPDGKRLSKQKSFDFFDALGAPTGKCSGGKCRLHYLLQEQAYFNQPGEYVITLEQFTRRDSLPGIYSAGLAIEPVKIKKQ